MLHFFRTPPLLDDNSADWIFSATAWVLKNFDHVDFFQRTPLVLPSNEFFPGRVHSVDEKAGTIFQHTLRYAGLAHWPFELKSQRALMTSPVADEACLLPPQPQSELSVIQRHSYTVSAYAASDLTQIPVIITESPLFAFYNPEQTLKPEDMAASFAHVLAQHLIIQAQQLPPGGQAYFAEGSELLASMMGFGVLLTNSAYTFRGGCGSCYNAMANRQPALGELENVFVLALFCRLKGIAYKAVRPHLKQHLRSSYKRALKQIDRRFDEVNAFKRLSNC